MKVLAIGVNADKVAAQFFKDATIERIDLQPHNWQMKGVYDALVSYHVLPCISHREVGKAARAWVACLKQGGEFQMFVPSLEWAARQILSPNPSPVTLQHLYGLQRQKGEFYISGFILRDLRDLCDKIGIDVEHARVGEYNIGEEICEMHLIYGRKR